MKENMVMVKSASDCTVVVDIPELTLRRTWAKCGAQYPIDRDLLEQAYYNPAVEYLFNHGLLVTEDKQFLYDVGLINDMEESLDRILLDEKLKKRLISVMPLREVEETLEKMSREQIEELVNYSIEHYEDLKNDRIKLFEKKSGKQMLKAIKNFQDANEDVPAKKESK